MSQQNQVYKQVIQLNHAILQSCKHQRIKKFKKKQPENNSTMGKEVLDQNRRTYDFVEGHNQAMNKSTANQIIEKDLLRQVSLIKTELKKQNCQIERQKEGLQVLSNKFELLHNNDQETVSSVKIGLTDSDKTKNTQGRIKIQYNLLRDLIVGELEIIYS